MDQERTGERLDLEPPVAIRSRSQRALGTLPRRLSSPLRGGAAFLVLLALWELFGRWGLFDPRFFGSPIGIIESYGRLFGGEGEIYPHLLVSALEAAIGIGLALLVGIPLGLLMGRYRLVRESLEPLVMSLNATPRVAFIPIIILVIGVGIESKVFLVFLGSIFPIIVNTQVGVENVEYSLIELLVSLRGSERQIFTKVVLPSSVPYILTGVRLAIGRALIMVVVAEMFASSEGIGFFISRKASAFLVNEMFVGITIFSIVGVCSNSVLRWLERRISPWRSTSQD